MKSIKKSNEFNVNQPEIENNNPEIKNTAFRRRLQSPRVNKMMATIRSNDEAPKQAILGADRSAQRNRMIYKYSFNFLILLFTRDCFEALF